MENMELIISQIRQRLEILYQIVQNLEAGGGSSGDSYTKAQTDALLNGKVDKVAGYGLSQNDFTDHYQNAITTTAQSLGILESDVESLFTQTNINLTQGQTFPSDYEDIFTLHRPFILNGITMYFVSGDSTLVDYFGIDNNGNLNVYFARITLSNRQLYIYTSFIGSSSPESGGTDLFTTGGAYTLEQAIQSIDNDVITLTNGLSYVINNGPKNLLQNGDATVTNNRWVNYPIVLQPGKYVIYVGEYSSTDTDSTTCQGYFFNSSDATASTRFAQTKANGMYQEITVTGTTEYLRIYASDNATHSQSGDSVSCGKVMVCPSELWNVTQTYIPYIPSNSELLAMIQAL